MPATDGVWEGRFAGTYRVHALPHEEHRMELYEWDPSLETGNELIDGQHRGIFELARTLHATCSECTLDGDDIANAVYGLSDYVIEHFADEEALMQASGYLEVSVHRGLHQALTAKVLTITARYFQGEETSLETLAPFVAEWLRTHIMEEDRRFIDFQGSK